MEDVDSNVVVVPVVALVVVLAVAAAETLAGHAVAVAPIAQSVVASRSLVERTWVVQVR